MRSTTLKVCESGNTNGCILKDEFEGIVTLCVCKLTCSIEQMPAAVVIMMILLFVRNPSVLTYGIPSLLLLIKISEFVIVS